MSHDVLDSQGNVSAALIITDLGTATFRLPNGTETVFTSVAEALDRIHALGGSVPTLEG